jgi:hypothetical protein
VRELDQDELTFADKSDLMVALLCILMLGGVAGWILHEQYIAKKLAETPVVTVQRIQAQPASALTTQLQCTKQELAEIREACQRRAQSALTKPKG